LGIPKRLWQGILRWLQQFKYFKPSYARYGTRLYWDDDEPFIQLYYTIGKGGIKDFTEIVCISDNGNFSKLVFKNDYVWGESDRVVGNFDD
jgi:hypothetical protein